MLGFYKMENRDFFIWAISFIEFFLLGLIFLLLEGIPILFIGKIIWLFMLALWGSILVILIYVFKRKIKNGN